MHNQRSHQTDHQPNPMLQASCCMHALPALMRSQVQEGDLKMQGSCDIVVRPRCCLRRQAHCADAPYVTVKGPVTTWAFALAYAPMEDFMPLAQEQLAASRLPYPDRDEMLQVPLQPQRGRSPILPNNRV